MDKQFYYNKCLEMRNMEKNLFWKRSLYFLILNISIAALLFSGFFQSVYIIPIAFSLLGFFSSLFWYKINLGTKHTQAKWEKKLANIEEEHCKNEAQKNNIEKLRVFSASEDFGSLNWKVLHRDVNKFGNIKKKISKTLFGKTSENFYLILSPLLFTILWLSIIVFFIRKW